MTEAAFVSLMNENGVQTMPLPAMYNSKRGKSRRRYH